MIDGTAGGSAAEPNWAAPLPVARELQRWVNTIPTWSDQSSESWEQFSRRHSKDEQDVTKRLRRLPGCTIARSTSGSATTLSLGGVEIRSQGGLAVACRDWIATVQKPSLKKPTVTEWTGEFRGPAAAPALSEIHCVSGLGSTDGPPCGSGS
jgi:hypothetical protein